MTVREYNYCVENYSDHLYRFALKNTSDDEFAKDIVQESLMRLWEKHKDIDFNGARSYLFTTAYRIMIDVYRKRTRMKVYVEETTDEHVSELHPADTKKILDEALKRLPEIQRIAVLLRDYEGYSYKEIGEITGLNESQVKVYIYRARMALKQYIGSMETVI